MATAVLNKVDKGISSIAKQFMNLPYGGGTSFAAIKQFIFITTDKKSVNVSKAILNNLKQFLHQLPTTDQQIKYSELNQNIIKTNHNIGFIEKVLADIDHFMYIGGAKVNADDQNMNTFLENIKKTKEGLQYCSDYLNLLKGVYKSKQQVKKSNTKTYTLQEVLNELKK